MDTLFYQPATKKKYSVLQEEMDIGGEKRTLCSGELAQQDDGSCLGHGFSLSLWKAAFEPHVSL